MANKKWIAETKSADKYCEWTHVQTEDGNEQYGLDGLHTHADAERLAADLNELEAYRANIKTIEYKGYVAELEIDLGDEIIVGRVINTETVIAFHDYGVTGIRGALIDCIEDYLECCFRQGIQPETPRIKS